MGPEENNSEDQLEVMDTLWRDMIGGFKYLMGYGVEVGTELFRKAELERNGLRLE